MWKTCVVVVVIGTSGCTMHNPNAVNDQSLESVASELATKRNAVRNREIPGTWHVAPVVLYRNFEHGGPVLQAIFVQDYSAGSPDPYESCAEIAKTSRDLVCIKRGG